MARQASLIDLERARLKRDLGVSAVAGRNKAFLAHMRSKARSIAAHRGYVTADDLREYAAAEKVKPTHPNAWGAIFRAPGWQIVGYEKSKVKSNNRRLIARWRYEV